MLAEAVSAEGFDDSKGEDVCVATISDGVVCDAVFAEAIPESEAKLVADVPVAEVFGFESEGDFCEDDKGCVEVKLSEMVVRADPDGVRRRCVELKDAIFCGRSFTLRGEASEGGLEDVEAVVLRDADLRRTLLHHAAQHGRARAISDLLSYANSYVPDPERPAAIGGDAAVRAYCDMRDDTGANALDVALQYRHDDCARLLASYTTNDGTKESKVEGHGVSFDRDEYKAEAK